MPEFSMQCPHCNSKIENIPEEKEEDFRSTLKRLPDQYTMDEFWKVAKRYKKYVSKPPTGYLLNLSTYPWNLDKNANAIYFDWELIKH